MEGKIAGLHAAGKRGVKMNYDLVSNIIFSHPEIGTVGLTEAEVKAQVRLLLSSIYDSSQGIIVYHHFYLQ